ncbi:MAG TPA: hypothetical protein VKT78_13360 [Fimbriimonadaceae bacterium]|nr:hypothetical protein [Fimbriimonadaceae bacterium]
MSLGIKLVGVAALAFVAHGRQGGPLQVVRNSPTSTVPDMVRASLPSLGPGQIAKVFQRAGVPFAKRGSSVTMDARHFFLSNSNYLHTVAAEVDPHGGFIGLNANAAATNNLLVYHTTTDKSTFLVDFVVVPITGSATLVTQAPDLTTQTSTVRGATHVSVVVYPSKPGVFGISLGCTKGEVSVSKVNIVHVG